MVAMQLEPHAVIKKNNPYIYIAGLNKLTQLTPKRTVEISSTKFRQFKSFSVRLCRLSSGSTSTRVISHMCADKKGIIFFMFSHRSDLWPVTEERQAVAINSLKGAPSPHSSHPL